MSDRKKIPVFTGVLNYFPDALSRHLIQAGTIDDDGMRHSAKVAWRALANLQKEIENDNDKWYKEQYNRNRDPKDHIK